MNELVELEYIDFAGIEAGEALPHSLEEQAELLLVVSGDCPPSSTASFLLATLVPLEGRFAHRSGNGTPHVQGLTCRLSSARPTDQSSVRETPTVSMRSRFRLSIKPEATPRGSFSDHWRMHDNWASEHEVRFGGLEGALIVCLGLGPTGVLISREMRVECGPLDGRVKAWFDFDLEAVRSECRNLLARPDLTGQLRISGAEHGEFSSIVDLDHGRGVISTTVAGGVAGADGGGTLTLTTDQSYLRQTLSELNQVPG